MPMMGYVLHGDNVYRCTEEQYKCPWPRRDGKEPGRTWILFNDDYLTKEEDGSYTVHTGIMCTNLHPDESKLEKIEHPINLTGV